MGSSFDAGATGEARLGESNEFDLLPRVLPNTSSDMLPRVGLDVKTAKSPRSLTSEIEEDFKDKDDGSCTRRGLED